DLLLHSSSRSSQFVVAGGCALLVLRPLLWQSGGDPTSPLVVLFLALLVIGAAWPAPSEHRPTATRLAVLALGVGAFALGRASGDWRAPALTHLLANLMVVI